MLLYQVHYCIDHAVNMNILDSPEKFTLAFKHLTLLETVENKRRKSGCAIWEGRRDRGREGSMVWYGSCIRDSPFPQTPACQDWQKQIEKNVGKNIFKCHTHYYLLHHFLVDIWTKYLDSICILCH